VEIRSFLAFEQPEEVRATLVEISDALRKTRLDVRWVKPANIHLTVHFLGNTRSEDLQAIAEPVQSLCLTYDPFHVSLSGVGCFPHTRNPRVLWVGLGGDVARMAQFRDALQTLLRPFGFQEEKRPFRAHLTLGRFRGGRSPRGELEEVLENFRGLSSPVCTLKDLVLFKSELRPGGSIYTKMNSWPLAGDAAETITQV